MRKRERENPCGVCGHYHKHEQGEVCRVCGHRPVPAERPAVQQGGGAFPTEILPDFLYLGSYDNASRIELLKTIGVSHVLNTVPACQNLYKNSFTYHRLQDDKVLQFDDAIQFIEQCGKDKARVLVHCMSGKSRSPAVVIAYLMKCKGWRLAQSFQWVKERRPQVELSPEVQNQLVEFEQKIFGPNEVATVQPLAQLDSLPSTGFGFPKPTDTSPVPLFNQLGTMSIFERMSPGVAPNNFVFGAGKTGEQNSSFGNSMDSS
ncbi:uncharacterized protein M6B38_289120 [Iris pallida]|uniref:Protein-tyrosine-phosphatase IBR5 n=1 Tax=Iris pallida TaxID=29817 RepID=A0AAX6E966_IRIPA|nr:uncharacterized protein M6B38_200700 [Iris pallida]KAJ6845191.1 uncharacterized protein M6B38_289120 [Iris pallida]